MVFILLQHYSSTNLNELLSALQTLTTIVALSMVLVAGFFVFNIPVWIDWLKYLSFIFYCYSLLLKVSTAHQPHHPSFETEC